MNPHTHLCYAQVDLTAVSEALQETLTLIVNYSASCLIAPGMFDEPEAAPQQLIKMMTAEDPVNGPPTGYVAAIIKALEEQDELEQVNYVGDHHVHASCSLYHFTGKIMGGLLGLAYLNLITCSDPSSMSTRLVA